MSEQRLLEIENLSVSFGSGAQEVKAVRGASLHIERGEIVALVGESGSGKTVTALSVTQLLPYPPAHHPSGSIHYADEEIIGASQQRLRQLRGSKISMIFQEPMSSLNPLHTIERQIGESLALHRGIKGKAAHKRIVELLELVGLAEAETRLGAFPHQLSGGQRQRVMIAMALANEPDLLIADEPTTALDVTIQAQILALLRELNQRLGMAILLITHDLAIVRKLAQRVYVMRAGEVVENGEVETLFAHPSHPYTQALLTAEPKGAPVPAAADASVILSAENLRVWFPLKTGLLRRVTGHVKAVDDISVRIREGHTVGVVGESGSGKTTLGLALLRLEQSQGNIEFQGQEIQDLRTRALRPLRREMQIVFQDPYGSLNPRMSIGQIIEEGLLVHRIGANALERDELVIQALQEVGLDPASRERYPHEFSGGQRQRVAIARAMILKPRLVILDEPTSALDVSVQAQIVDLLRELQARHSLAYLFISHDLKVVRALSDELIVMHEGKVVEQGSAEQIFSQPREAYTRRLLAAALDLDAA